MQTDLIETALLGSDLGFVFLFATMALTPAICEELLFRGYFQRQVERRWGVAASIGLVGLVFGLYHLRLTQALPLAALGMYLGYVVWATGSLWTGVLVHALNNGLAVATAMYVRANPNLTVEEVEALPMPWYLVAAGLLGLAAASVLLARRRAAVTAGRPDAALVAPPEPAGVAAAAAAPSPSPPASPG